MDWILPVFLGVGLSAATGIRIFLPFFIISLCSYFDLLSFGDQFSWLDNPYVVIALGVATAVEIAGYYIPLIDHILDIIATPMAFIAGIISMSSALPEMPMYFDNLLSLIIGGGTAVSINGMMGFWRVKTTASFFGFANPAFSTIENILSGLFTVLSFLIPVVFGLFILFVVIASMRFVRKLFRSGLTTRLI